MKDYKDIECLSETDEDKIADEIKKEPIIEVNLKIALFYLNLGIFL